MRRFDMPDERPWPGPENAVAIANCTAETVAALVGRPVLESVECSAEIGLHVRGKLEAGLQCFEPALPRVPDSSNILRCRVKATINDATTRGEERRFPTAKILGFLHRGVKDLASVMQAQADFGTECESKPPQTFFVRESPEREPSGNRRLTYPGFSILNFTTVPFLSVTNPQYVIPPLGLGVVNSERHVLHALPNDESAFCQAFRQALLGEKGHLFCGIMPQTCRDLRWFPAALQTWVTRVLRVPDDGFVQTAVRFGAPVDE